MVVTFERIAAEIKKLKQPSVLHQKYISQQTKNPNISKNNQISVKVDRLFICVRDGKRAISFLEELGLKSSQSVIRSVSQGTLSKIFFFNNLYLEVIWLEKEIEPNREELGTSINFNSRTNWQQTNTSPFGVGIVNDCDKNNTLLDTSIINDLIIDNLFCYFQQNHKNCLEPFIFLLPEYLTIQNSLNQLTKSKAIAHSSGVHDITNITIKFAKGRRRSSNILKLLQNNSIIQIEYAEAPLIELTFDGGINNKSIDARPILPLILKY